MVHTKGHAPPGQDISEVDAAINDAVLAQVMLERAREVVQAYQDARDASIRAAARLGADRTALAASVGIARRSVYVAIDAPRDDDDARVEWFIGKAIEAEAVWEANGGEGSIDDYWPL